MKKRKTESKQASKIIEIASRPSWKKLRYSQCLLCRGGGFEYAFRCISEKRRIWCQSAPAPGKKRTPVIACSLARWFDEQKK
jgi:hypothetical protein